MRTYPLGMTELATLGLVWAETWCLPFSACECWPEAGDWSTDEGSINMRFFDHRDGLGKPRHPTDWSRAWDDTLEGRHRSKQIAIPASALLLSMDEIRERMLPEYIDALKGITQ